LAINGQYVEIQ